ncbi:MAG: ABC transporter ATP-binding protein [Bacteroidetes bacterium]|nr:MAG: ABC transporter ATP-binding protein [Bacteroidota bacterium]
MKRFSTILFYLRGMRSNIFLYFVCIVLSILFSLVSLAMLAPFLQLLFGKEKLVNEVAELELSTGGVLNYLKYYLSQVIRTYGANRALAIICVAIIISVFFKNLFTYLSFRVLAPMRNYVMTKLRGDLYEKILQLPIGYFTEQRKGDIISRMSNDANEVEWSVMSTLEGLIREPLNLIIIISMLVYLSPLLSLFMLVLLPVMGFIIGRVSRSLKKQSGQSQEQLGVLMSILDETLTGLRVIKAFNAEYILGAKFAQVNTTLNNIRNKMNFRRDLASPLSEFLGVVVLSCILWFGGKLVLSHSSGLEADAFITYIVFFTQIINPAKALSTAFYNAQKGSAAIARIEEVLQAPVVIKNSDHAKPLQKFQQAIEFKNVCFSYNDVPILKNISLTIPYGKTVALVGASGSGKSTLADLVPRFHDVSSGEILIDGTPIQQLDIASLRKQISIVTQEAILFNDTVANNISLGTPDATQTQIEEAAKAANAYNFISQKEHGFATNVGDRGGKLSGGERQRVTIARALLKNPPILILDEATSALDTESERLVQEAINTLMKNRTSLVIAHRLSTIQHADEIVVLQNGEIAEQGTHHQLLALDGIYKKLVTMQAVR